MYSNLYALYKFPYTSQHFIFCARPVGEDFLPIWPGMRSFLKKSSIYYHYFDFNLFYIYIRAHNENKPKRFTLV